MRIIGQNAKELLLSKSQFIIPIYQRDYAWGKEDCQRLFDDFTIGFENKQSHFLGSYCEKTEDEYAIVIDGQQRIVSLMLFLIALRDVSINEIFQDFIDISFLTLSDKTAKLELKKKDNTVFEKLVFERDGIFGRTSLTKEDEASRIYQNYDLFYAEISTWLEAHRDFQLAKFIERLEDFKFAKITLEEENPQVVYETLNATGVALSEIDKIRNFILMPLSSNEQKHVYFDYWEPLEDILGRNFERFLASYFIIREQSSILSDGEKVSHKTIYSTFKKFTYGEDMSAVVKNILEFASFYKDLISNNKFFNIIYNTLNSDEAMALLLYLTQKESEFKTSLQEAFETYLSYVVRNKVCERGGIKNEHAVHVIRETQKAKSKEEFLSLFNSAFLSAQGSFKFPSNREFKESLMNKDIYLSLGSSGVKYLLYEIEKADSFEKRELPPFQEGSIEHIMPQLLSQEWERILAKDKSCYTQYLHTLGNLAITKYNSELHNKIFAEKCVYYNLDSYHHTKNLLKYKQWGTASIQHRAEALSNIAIGIWKDISILESKDENAIGIYNELQTFVGTKPYRVNLMGEEKDVKSWNDLLYFVASVLYDTDAVAMLQFLNKKEPHKFLFNRVPNGPYRKLGDSIFLKTSGDANQKFENLKRLVEYYDKTAEITISDKLWFKLISV